MVVSVGIGLRKMEALQVDGLCLGHSFTHHVCLIELEIAHALPRAAARPQNFDCHNFFRLAQTQLDPERVRAEAPPEPTVRWSERTFPRSSMSTRTRAPMAQRLARVPSSLSLSQ